MTRDELIAASRALVDEGDALQATPSLTALRDWLARSDALLAEAWGTMDRYHLAWLLVGKPRETVRGRPMTPEEEAAYVRDVASQKTAAIRMSLDAVERQGMPFRGEDGHIEAGPSGQATAGRIDANLPPGTDDLAARIRRAREEGLADDEHARRRAPRPERMQR